MGELLRCKVRNITCKHDAQDRWEIRFKKRVLPSEMTAIAGKPITLKFSDNNYAASTGIALHDSPGQYFWINTHMDVSGYLKNILGAYHYKPNDVILLHVSQGKKNNLGRS